MAENLLVEVDSPAPGASGELIVTDFYNTATPLIRYRIGDFATAETGQCSCGRGLPVLSAVHGRAYDLLRLSSGKVVHPEAVIYVFENLQASTHAFKQFQVIQKTVELVELRVVPAQSWSNDAKEGLIAGVKNALEPTMEVRVELVPTLARERSGKMRLVKSEVR
jgi:phenylacetate-CoA ligase